MSRRPDVAVLGGGIGGLASAWYLARAGCRVTVLEGSDRFGGLGTFFEVDGRSYERFYHVMLPSDGPLLGLLDELGIGDRPAWTDSSFALLTDRRLHRLDTALDLLRFGVLSPLDRIRLGVTALYGRLPHDQEVLDRTSVADWLTRISGRRAFARFWKPLLEAKFGDAYRQIPALWYWARFNREKNSQKEVKGYPRGGYRGIVDRLVEALEGAGVELRTGVEVTALDLAGDGEGGVELRTREWTRTFGRIVSTLPLPVLDRVAEGAVARRLEAQRVSRIDYQGALNVVLMLDRSLVDHYWVAVVDEDIPFRGLVETSRVLGLEETGGRHLVYLANYLHRTDPRFQEPDEAVMAAYLEGLQRLFPHFSPSWILHARVFRAPFVEPIYFPGYAAARPPAELVPGRVFLATTAQVYPRVTAWNSTVELAREVARLAADGATSPPVAPPDGR